MKVISPMQLTLLAYTLLLVYGTWFPIGYWDWELGGLNAFLAMEWPSHISRPDLVINLIVYVPLGFAIAWVSSRGTGSSVALATMTGFLLSCGLELGQTYLPNRVTSPSDIMLNSVGSFAGAVGGRLVARSQWFQRLFNKVIAELRHPGTGRLGVLVLMLWVASQWSPFVPSLDLGNLKHGLEPFRSVVNGETSYLVLGYLKYLAMLGGLLALGIRLFRDRERATVWLLAGLFAVLSGKVLIMTRQLSPEALLAAITVTVAALPLRRLSSPSLQLISLTLLISYQLFETFTPAALDPTLRAMNWIPFRGQMNSLTGIIDLINGLWLYAAYAYLMYPRSHRSSDGLALRLSLVAPWALLLEWGQQIVPGRYADITDVFMGVGAFVLAYSYPWRRDGTRPPARQPFRWIPRSRWHRALGLVGAVTSLLFVVSQFNASSKATPYKLPESAELPNPNLPNFDYDHPRLPAPSPSDWLNLSEDNPEFLQKHRNKARGENFYSRTLIARLEPGTIDLDKLFNDLIALEFSWRGHQQTLPIALAYDWLYDQWKPIQRELLLAKAEQACRFQENVIRDQMKLSPYNVYLYNSPLQALVAVSLAIHGDASSGDCMRFAHDYWKNRVLPVWRQVMGTRGGWHEGGEYVGIGIGQAIHRIPAMWRNATGEDLFAARTGIRGFLDFVLHRQRPDGTSMRLGDVAYVSNAIPDLAPLALEYRHAAAYTKARPPVKPTPLAYPWGPMSDATLLDDTAMSRQPTARWFDGIGVMTARSDWSEDATFVTFKAGNNYWSHMHLDQGSFTIFKGSGLAIDSGVYFDYGGEHHMNYTYQSIAHNVVTVTDPQDSALMPGKERTNSSGKKTRKPDRMIANDGGQRRVGSGWGLAAPLDLMDWNSQRERYQTVGEVLIDSDAGDGIIWVNADLTPAYTNAKSRNGEFFARTRRIDRYFRSWVYLPELDIVLVHDRVSLAKTGMRPRWLLHSQLEPSVGVSSFSVPGADAHLHARVLSPSDANIQSIGGSGFEFYIEGKNYDQNGGAARSAAKRKGLEPGSWRVEVTPALEERKLEFLVALSISDSDGLNVVQKLVTSRNRRGTEVSGLPDGLTLTLPAKIAPVQKATKH